MAVVVALFAICFAIMAGVFQIISISKSPKNEISGGVPKISGEVQEKGKMETLGNNVGKITPATV